MSKFRIAHAILSVLGLYSGVLLVNYFVATLIGETIATYIFLFGLIAGILSAGWCLADKYERRSEDA